MNNRRVVDLTAEELDRLAGEAWNEAAKAALAAGAPVVGRQGNKIVKIYPDGHFEILGAAEITEEHLTAADKKSERSIA
jgi:hypothetical protein